MKFVKTEVDGAFIIEPDLIEDERGFFARSWSQREFAEKGISSQLVECNISYNNRKGIMRGLHFQKSPHGQAKLVRCTAGSIFDVLVDLRPDSPTRFQWTSVELTAANHRMLFVPVGCAHGYQTLSDNSEVFYQMSSYYVPNAFAGVRWNDPTLGIKWPIADPIMFERDRNLPLVEDVEL